MIGSNDPLEIPTPIEEVEQAELAEEARHLAALIGETRALKVELDAATDRVARLARLGSFLERDGHGDL